MEMISKFRMFSSIRKLIKPKANRPIVQKQRLNNEEHERRAKEMGLGWRIVSSSILHRYPVIFPDPEPWELEMWNIQERIEDNARAV